MRLKENGMGLSKGVKMKISFKRDKDGLVTVHFDKMTQGGALALCNAITVHAKGGSAVGDDLRALLRNQIQLGHTDADQQLFEILK